MAERAHTQGLVTELGDCQSWKFFTDFYLKAFSKVCVWEFIPLPVSGKDLGCYSMKIRAQVGSFVCVVCSRVYVS